MDEEQKKQVQEKLEALCVAHDMKPFNLENEKGRALELVRRMCGLPHKKVGRPTDSLTREIGAYVSAQDDFYHDIDKTDPEVLKKKAPRKELYRWAIEHFSIKPKIGQHGNKSNPENTVRRACDKFKKEREAELEELSNNLPDDHIPLK